MLVSHDAHCNAHPAVPFLKDGPHLPAALGRICALARAVGPAIWQLPFHTPDKIKWRRIKLKP